MKTKFWSVCTIAVLALLGSVYFLTAQMSDAPVVLSDSQMEQLSGTRVDWTCKEFEACDNITCNSTNLVKQTGRTGCYSCDTLPNDTCYYSRITCSTCAWVQYKRRCGGEELSRGWESYSECSLS
jgi:hypothetical protein